MQAMQVGQMANGQNAVGLPHVPSEALANHGLATNVTMPGIGQVHGPAKKFRAGAVCATIWKNDRQRATGETFSYHTVSLERSYKDQAGNWKTASSMRLQDLPKAALVLNEAYRYLALNGASADEVVVE